MKSIAMLLAPIMILMFVVGFVQEANGGASFSLDAILNKLSEFRYSFDDTLDTINFILSADLFNSLEPWDSSLTGLDGFFTNMGNVIRGFLNFLSTLFSVVVVGLWYLVTDSIKLFGSLLLLFIDVLGLGRFVPSGLT